jgi:FAD/FMN-containing dehydrogenase
MSSAAGWRHLEATIAGNVALPEHPEYHRTYPSLNARFDDVRPRAVVRCASSEDVVETLRFAGRAGVIVAIRGGGHCFGGRSSTDGLLLDVSNLRSVEISQDLVTVGGGTPLGEIYESLLADDLVIPAGSCPSVGVAGLALGGGLGLLGRKHGLTSDHLVSARVVLADGRLVDCDAHHDDDLFWALRGAGAGNFGVVTSLTFRTLPAPTATNFHVAWPFSEAEAVISAWLAWAPSAPDELAASLFIGAGPQVDEPPSVEVPGIMLGTESDASELIHGLVDRVGSDPTSAFRRHMSFRETSRYWGERAAREPVPEVPPGWELRGCRFIKSEFFAVPPPSEAIAALLRHFEGDRVPGQSRELDFSPWGGGYNRVAADATAFVHRHDRFWLKHAAEVHTEASSGARRRAHEWAQSSWGAVHRWGTGRVFPNFPDPDLEDWPRAYYGDNLARLMTVKARYDPGNRFRFAHSMPLR